MNANRANFFADYQTLSMKNLMEKWFPMTLKVRINTILRILAFKLGIYNQSKRIVKSLIGKK